jgi:hypothetical protein
MNNDITFIIACQMDSKDRFENLSITLNVLRSGFPDSPVILLEADTENKLKNSFAGTHHEYVPLAPGEVFNKMKLYNQGARLAASSVLCFVDVDVPPSKTAVLEAYKLITNNTYDVVYPYGKAKGYNVPKEYHGCVRAEKDIPEYDEVNHEWLKYSHPMPYVESGGILLVNSAAYCNGGGGNENFVGWGCEDDEMLSRFAGLGYRLGRLEDKILVHLEHERTANPLWYDYAKYEKANRERLAKVQGMNRQDLQIMVAGWNNFGGPATHKKDLTVIISASYLDSHPEITFMREVIESLELTGIPLDTPIILSHDRIKDGVEGYEEKKEAYLNYFENLDKYARACKFTNITISVAPYWGHLTRSLKHAVSLVKTKYMLVLQHDIHIRRDVPVLELIDLMERHSHIKHLRFNVRRNHPTFMWWDGYQGGKQVFHEEVVDGVKLCFTPAWSDQNHLATKEYYENVVFPDCTNDDGELIYDFMENRMNGLCHHNHPRYGTYIYGGYGAPRTSRHSDGRKSSPEPDED